MSAFEFYESHIETNLNHAQSLIASAQSQPDNVSKDSYQEARRRIDQAKAALEDLKREMFLLPTNDRAAAQRRFQQFKENCDRLENSLQNNINRLQLMGGSYDVRMSAAVDQSLAQTSQICAETTEIGHGILANLNSQKKTLMGSMSNVDEIHRSVSGTKRLVNKMQQIQRQNKFIMWAVVGLLVAAIVILFYLRFF